MAVFPPHLSTQHARSRALSLSQAILDLLLFVSFCLWTEPTDLTCIPLLSVSLPAPDRFQCRTCGRRFAWEQRGGYACPGCPPEQEWHRCLACSKTERRRELAIQAPVAVSATPLGYGNHRQGRSSAEACGAAATPAPSSQAADEDQQQLLVIIEDYYSLLGLPPSASFSRIQAEYEYDAFFSFFLFTLRH